MSSTRIHAIQTGTVAIKELQRSGNGTSLPRVLAARDWTEPLPIHAWLIEHPEGLILVDTGETARTAEPGYFTRWHPYFRLGVREWVEPQEEIGPRMKELGFDPDDVRTVVLTHFHTDHAGGLAHFPHARILSSRLDYELARGLGGKARGFLPQHWPAWYEPAFVDFGPQRFGPFEESMPLTRAGDVHVLPTPGHTPGHVSVAVEDGETVVFLAGDTSYTEQLMLDGVADGVSPDAAKARETLARIRELATHQPTIYLPTHDPDGPRRLAQREPAAASIVV